MSGVFSSIFPGYLLQVSPSALAKRDSARAFPVNPGPAARITKFQLAVADAHFGADLQNFILIRAE